jgi:hypothetical protein
MDLDPAFKKVQKTNILAKVESYPSSPWSSGSGLLRFAAGSGSEQKVEMFLKLCNIFWKNSDIPHISWSELRFCLYFIWIGVRAFVGPDQACL